MSDARADLSSDNMAVESGRGGGDGLPCPRPRCRHSGGAALGATPGKAERDVSDSPLAGGTGHYVPHRPRAASELRALISISQALTGRLDPQRVVAAALEVVADVVGAEGASILLIDPQTGGMSFHVAAGPGAEAVKTISLPPGAGICGEVARSGRPLIVNDAQHDPRLYRPVDQSTGIVTRELLCVPVRSMERLLGVLELVNKRGRDGFDEDDLRLAEGAAAQIALALENAQLHADIVRKERLAVVGRTVSGLAHCIKNILNGIRSGAAVVDRAVDAGDYDALRRGWQVVRDNNEMLGNLVLDMLSLARESECHPFPTDVNDLTAQVCRLMADRAAERGIRVSCRAHPALNDVLTDPTKLYRCLLNLVTNAVDACEDGGRVCARVYRGRGRQRLTISVTDDGQGVPAEQRGKLFGEFFTTKGSRGTGLGLPVTKKLITAMGGSIAFHSLTGRGTRFVIALPADAEPASPKETH